jgi:acyl-CoA synthetase (AMP-forming)/AMP-acid ligase II
MTNEPQLLTSLFNQRAEATALIEADDGTTVSYARLAAEIETLAGKLRAAGVGRGDRVALVIPQGPTCVRLILAIAALGAAAAPLNPAYTEDEYAFYFEDLRPRLLLLPARELPAARAAADERVRVVEVDGAQLLPGPSAAYEDAEPDDIALLLHTSGTTSRPKQVPLLQRNLIASARSIAAFYELGPDDVSYCAMPLFHVHGLVASTLAALAGGGSVVVPSRVAPRRLWAHLRAHGVTWLSAGPTLHQMILEKADGHSSTGALRFVRSCSSALPPELWSRSEDVYGVPMLEAYGMTEASHQMASNPLPPAARVPGSVGVPSGVELRLVDPEGADVEIGEVAVRGPGITPGYLANRQANAESFFGDGWFRTGDSGRLDDGYLRLEGRIKEMILRGGENISPYEIEETLRAHPAVLEAVAFGIEDEKYGEEVGAAVALCGEADERALRDWCTERLATFKVPKTIFVLDAIPRTATGKLQRKRIAQQLTSA